MKKIAFLLPVNGIAGGLFIVNKQAKNLVTQGYDVTFIYESYIKEVEDKYQLDPRINVIKTFEDLKDNDTYDLAIATWWKTAFSVFKIKSNKYAYFVQSDERKFYDEEIKSIDRANRIAVQFTYQYFPGTFITEAKWIAAMLKNEFNRTAMLAPNGIDTNIFNTKTIPHEQHTDKIRFLVEGPSNVPFKRVEYAHLCLSKFYKDIEIWHIANDGAFRPYWKADKIFTEVPYLQMPPIFRSCDLIIKLSTVEGFFGPPLEMMACGGTALTSNVTGHDELLQDNVNGYVVRMDDYEQTSNVINNIVKNGRQGLAHLKENAIATAASFAWEKQHPQFVNAVETALLADEHGDMQLLKIIGEMYLRDPLYFLEVYEK